MVFICGLRTDHVLEFEIIDVIHLAIETISFRRKSLNFLSGLFIIVVVAQTLNHLKAFLDIRSNKLPTSDVGFVTWTILFYANNRCPKLKQFAT
jgi:hypothetical protein